MKETNKHSLKIIHKGKAMKKLHRVCFIVVILLQLMNVDQSNAQTITKIEIQNFMTDIEFQQSGLTKLSDEELDNLNN